MGEFPGSPMGRGKFLLDVLIVCGLSISCVHRTPVEVAPADSSWLGKATIEPYRLQIADEIAVLFWGSPELDQELVVRPDGMISLPFVDEVVALGRTPAELDAKLTELYSRELARPEITVIVRRAGGQVVFIGGEVAEPGTVELGSGLTMYQAIQMAGGFLDTSRRHEVVVIRTLANGERIAAAVDLMPVVSGANPSLDPPLQRSDIVFVPRAKILSFRDFLTRYFYDLLPIRVVGTVELFTV